MNLTLIFDRIYRKLINVRSLSISNSNRLNHQIRAPRLRVIDEDGNQLGVMTRSEALAEAERAELDLVEISPNADPPVVKIVDWGKFNYQRMKQIQKNKRSAKNLELKQMRVGLKISAHDLEVKAKKVREFLAEGHKVKYTLRFKGRELAHKEVGFNLAQRIIDSFGETIAVDQKPTFLGKQLTFVIRQTANAKSVDKQVAKIGTEQGEQDAETKNS